MTYKLVVFDFDGTLADSFPWFLVTINAMADKYGFKRIEGPDVDRLRSLSSHEIIAQLGLPLWKIPIIASDLRRKMTESVSDIRLFDGIEQMLSRLAGCGIRIAVVTSNVYENVLAIMGSKNTALISHFECGASLFGKKAKFRRLLKITGVSPYDTLYIGDEIRDAQAASECGIEFAGVAWGYTSPEALAPWVSKQLFRSVNEMADIICRHAGRNA